MQKEQIVENVRKIASTNGIDVYRIQTDKFKTNSVNFFFKDTLSRDSATKNALLPAVIRRGCKSQPTFRDIALKLEELYGASFDCGVTKKGEVHIIQFYAEFLSDRYVPGDTKQFDSVFDLLYEIVNEPVLENGIFRQDYLEVEKDNLKKLIESRVNDKMQYAVERCLEEMCKNEPYGIYDYGYVSDLPDITSNSLYEHYQNMLTNYPLEVYFAGDIDDAGIKRALDKLSKMKRGQMNHIVRGNKAAKRADVANVTEKMNVNQGKLSLGFRTNTPPDSLQYYSLMVFNGILGGGLHSKLFQNVREKASLAYYAFSRLEKFKELMVISSGIEIKNRERAVEIIMEQLDEIKKGNITDYEFNSTIKSIETGMKSLRDSQMQIVDYYLSQNVAGTKDSFDDIIEKCGKVTKEDVVEISKQIRLETIYFLTSAG